MDITNVGWHTSVKELLNTSEEFLKKHTVYQVFVGSPRTLQVPSFTDLAILKARCPWLEIVVHMPYVVNLCKSQGEDICVKTLHYMIKVAEALDKVGVKYMVTHIGARPASMDVKESATHLWTFCTKWLLATQNLSVKLCLENDTGSKAGTKMGHLRVLELVIKKCNSDRVRMCFDSEHAYGAGFDIEDVENIKKYEDLIDVVHWNSVPKNVIKGGHLDRHSTTSFYDSKVSPIPVYNALYNGVRPFIFEVESPVFVKSNLMWLKECSNG